jgi:RNA recognition motif-containing protein
MQAQQQGSTSLTSSSVLSGVPANAPGSRSFGTPAGDFRSPGGYNAFHGTPPPLPRQPSTEKMDFLADVASMQQAQPQIQQSQSRTARPSMPPISRRTSAMPSPADHMMSDAPTATLQPRAFKASSLTTNELQMVSKLTKQLSENSFLYDTHTELIKILQDGFRRHVLPPDETIIHNPHDYSLLLELRQARDAMDSRFPVGEELWNQWIQDEAILAETIEDRAAVMNLCKKAVSDEVGSTKLWRLFGDWMVHLFKSAHDIPSIYEGSSLDSHPIVGEILSNQTWTEEDKMLGPEIFPWEAMMDVWRSGSKATEWHINDSHVVWDPFMQILLQDLAGSPTAQKLEEIKRLFSQRLQIPHATWENTFQMFSQFISQYDNAAYEDIMVSTKMHNRSTIEEYSAREEYEQKLTRAVESGDKVSEWTVLSEYLEAEAVIAKNRQASRISFDLFIGLYERAHLRFPTDAGMWEDHIDAITETGRAETLMDSLAHNATRHCAWSGNLWAKRLVALEVAGVAFEHMEDAKHHATSTGLLEEVGGIEELIKVQTAWCGFLRRRAFSTASGEDEVDMAEVGILSALEEIKALGTKKEGPDFKGDPDFKVERIYIKFLSQVGRDDEARQFWLQLSAAFGDRWEFWERFYTWEVAVWGRGGHQGKGLASPENATAVLLASIRRPKLDWPEKMIEMYLHHCRQHETVQKVQEAQVEARRASKLVVIRRANEAEEAAILQQQYQAANPVEPVIDPMQSGKRKLSQLETISEEPSKRSRADDDVEMTQNGTSTTATSTEVKRDRENTTVVVRKIPAATTEARVRQFFRDCGVINNITVVPDKNADTATATLEFESKEDVLSALTKSMKTFDGNSIEIQVGTNTTLYVSNYPPEADETYIRNLFKQFGEIFKVRFPSLKYNAHRRFCYVQFSSASEAEDATSLDGKTVEGNFKLQAKISDPNAKKDRQGALQEGREIYVGNFDYGGTENDLRSLFSPYGTVDSVRVQRGPGGRSKGAAWVIFHAKEDAEKATEEMNGKDFNDRLLSVEISKEKGKGPKKHATMVINDASASPVPEATHARSPSAVPSDAGNSRSAGLTATTAKTGNNQVRDAEFDARILRLRKIPDTVNDARIRALVTPFGSLKKIDLYTEKGEARIEFEHASDVGKAEMSLQGYEIVPGVNIEVAASGVPVTGGSLTGGPGRNTTGGPGGDVIKGKKSSAPGAAMPFAPVTRRPVQGAKRGGLGYKKGIATGANRSGNAAAGRDTDMLDAGPKVEKKSNDDFRKMMEGGK